MTQQNPGPAVFTVAEVARYLRISRNRAYSAVRDGTIPSVRVGSRILIPVRELEAWLHRSATK